MPETSALGRLKQEACQSAASLGYMRPSLKYPKQTKINLSKNFENRQAFSSSHLAGVSFSHAVWWQLWFLWVLFIWVEKSHVSCSLHLLPWKDAGFC